MLLFFCDKIETHFSRLFDLKKIKVSAIIIYTFLFIFPDICHAVVWKNDYLKNPSITVSYQDIIMILQLMCKLIIIRKIKDWSASLMCEAISSSIVDVLIYCALMGY